MEIGSKIKNARNRASLTQEQAAEALGVSRQTVSNWETGKSYPDIISVIKMSDLYSVSLDHLLKEEKDVKQTYIDYLEESTNVVKSKSRLAKTILITAYLVIWAAAEITFWLSFLLPSATASEIGPTLPKYIVTMIISFPIVLSVAVRFLESPTVAVALTVS